MTPPVPETLYCAECGQLTAKEELAWFGNLLICPRCKEAHGRKLGAGAAPAPGVIYGGFWIRFLAYVIDAIILAIAGSMVQVLFVGRLIGPLLQEPGTVPTPEMLGRLVGTIGLFSLVGIGIAAIYEGLFVAKFGATPGKMALSLKVVRPDGSPVLLGRAFGRYFGKLLSSFTLLIGFIIAGFDSQKRALHDMLCDTRVISIGN
jgi:uncharacterized RDD family membrane protein YckC